MPSLPSEIKKIYRKIYLSKLFEPCSDVSRDNSWIFGCSKYENGYADRMGYKKANEKLLRLSNHSRINSSTIKLASTTSYPTAATITDGNLFNIFCSTINRLPFYSKMGNCFTADYGEYNNGCMQMRDNVPLPTCDMISVMEKTRPPSIRRMKHRLLPFYFIPMFTSANDYRTPNTIGVYNRWRTIM